MIVNDMRKKFLTSGKLMEAVRQEDRWLFVSRKVKNEK